MTTSPTALLPILLVDDDPNDRLLFRRAAKKARFANPIVEAANGEEAIEAVQRATAESSGGRAELAVVILDLKMPRMSGFEVLDWMRGQGSLSRIPVVVFTASNQDPDVARAYDLGANSYLVKPVTFDALIEMVRTLGLYWAVFNEAPKVDVD